MRVSIIIREPSYQASALQFWLILGTKRPSIEEKHTSLWTDVSSNLFLQLWYAEVASRNENIDVFWFAESGEGDGDYVYF